MRERLWEVAERFTCLWINLLGKQTEIIGERQDVIEGPLRSINVASTCKIVDSLETADAECALS